MAKYKIGLTFGVFDVFHKGHYNLLTKASKLCEKLFVFVSDSDYAFKHKGHYPIWSWEKRTNIIKYITKINRIEHQTNNISKKDIVKLYKPDVLIVGDDWTPKTYTGEGLGVPVIYIPYTKGVSSTITRKNAQYRLP